MADHTAVDAQPSPAPSSHPARRPVADEDAEAATLLLSPATTTSSDSPTFLTSRTGTVVGAASGDHVNLPWYKRNIWVRTLFLERDARYPFSAIYINSFLCYLTVPGLEPYMTNDPQVLLWTANMFLVGNVFGRYITTFIPAFALRVQNCIMLLLTATLIMIAAVTTFGSKSSNAGEFMLYLITPIIMFVFSAFAGYTNTMGYAYIQKTVGSDKVDRLSRWASIVNQLGALSGTLVGLILVLAVFSN
jgi:hypothetical protein